MLMEYLEACTEGSYTSELDSLILKSFFWHIWHSSLIILFVAIQIFSNFLSKPKWITFSHSFVNIFLADDEGLEDPRHQSSPRLLIFLDEPELKVTCVCFFIVVSSQLFAIISYLALISHVPHPELYNPRIDIASSTLILCIVDKFCDFFKAARVSCFSHFFCLA